MESEFPIIGQTARDFKNAELAYKKRFGQNPPGSGNSYARYHVIVTALEVDLPADLNEIEKTEKAFA